MKINIALLTILMASIAGCTNELDYYVDNGKFFTSEGEIPKDCFGQLITEQNGDNSIASIFISRASLRGCLDANFPYPGGEGEISYSINEKLSDDRFKLKVCQKSGGSMRSSCDNVLVQFVNREYVVNDKTNNVLTLDKFGEW